MSSPTTLVPSLINRISVAGGKGGTSRHTPAEVTQWGEAIGLNPVPLVYASRSVHGPRAINPLNPKYAMMIAVWKRLPVRVAMLAGPVIARGLG